MPTIKPRVAVTLEPHTHEVIERLAQLQGRTRGSVIADLLESVAPALTRTVALLEAAAAAPDDIKRGLRTVVEQVHGDLVEAAGASIVQLDMLLDGTADAGVDPHVVTRGSGMGTTRGSAAKKNPANPGKSRAPARKAKPKAE
ncbi:hypothetical protein [Pseudomonas sp.]|uniref:hypothetical protein n=1 Tax=Pseudomonas sp. TaxID=306 RepID=UPI00258D9A62|nr:hypothetical protein [Pseudomonas sp.]